MKTLYSWNGDSNEFLYELLKEFNVIANEFNLIKYEKLSPDSTIWFFSLEEGMFCLYAEDYVPSLKHVEDSIKANLPAFYPYDEYKLVEVKNKIKWKDSSPVLAATSYKQPENPDVFMKYAAFSGSNFVFLAKSKLG